MCLVAATGSDQDDKFCCDGQQVDDMFRNLKMMSQVVGRCPSCVKNLRNVFCFMTCDPHQSKYLSPINTDEVAKYPTVPVVTDLNYYIKEKFARNMFDSCSEVRMPSSSTRAITKICGAWGELCNANR